jgi:hypothetical protein
MTAGDQQAILSGEFTFAEILDSACDKLQERKIRFSIQRIHELEERLDVMERELDAFLLEKNNRKES